MSRVDSGRDEEGPRQLILIGLTGGIASGKSTVARLLESKGATVIDADQIAREVVEPGRPAHQQILDRFGTVDRARLAEIVFSDAGARRDLEAITHPEIYQEIARRIDSARERDGVVVLDAALLVETLPDRGRALGLDALVVVAAHVEDQIERMARDRDMTADQARARMSAQAPQERKMAMADYVIDNRGEVQALEASVDTLWEDLLSEFGR